MALGWTEPYWVPEAIVLLVLYILMGKRERIREKAIGTALGVIAVIQNLARIRSGCSGRDCFNLGCAERVFDCVYRCGHRQGGSSTQDF